MSLIAPSVWLPRIATLLLVALIAVTVTFWVLRLRQQAPKLLAPSRLGDATQVDSQAIARVLGSTEPALPPQTPSNASRFVLAGVLATRSGRGVALIAVDGKPARVFHVGATVDDALMLRSVGERHATLGVGTNDEVAVTLALPALKKLQGTSAQVAAVPPPTNQIGPAPTTPSFGPPLNATKNVVETDFQNKGGANQF